jgi:hypothetical protein
MTDTSDEDVLPPLTPVEGLDILDPLSTLTDEERQELNRALDDMARARRQAEASTAALQLG